MDIFSSEGKLMTTLNDCMDYVLLNIIALIFSIPVVTAGAAFSAKYYVSMKMARGEAPKIWSPFWKAFKQNFKKSTIFWVIEIAIMAVLFIDWRIIFVLKVKMPIAVMILLGIVSMIIYMIFMYIYPLQARFELGIKQTFKYAFLFAIMYIYKNVLTIIMIGIGAFASYEYLDYLPAVLIVVSTIVLYYNSKIFTQAFKVLEGKQEKTDEIQDASEHVVSEDIIRREV